MSAAHAEIPDEAFERILRDAIVRPAGRSFRGEPARQVEVLRLLRTSAAPQSFDQIFDHLKRRGVLRSRAEDPTGRRKLVRQLLQAVNDKLGAYFFRVPDVRMLDEMFRVQVRGEENDAPEAFLQDFFGIRKVSGVRFFATSAEPAGGLTRELYELVTALRPHRLDVYAASFSSFLGNPEFRALLEARARQADARLRFLLLDPASPSVATIEAAVAHEVPLRGGIRDRIELSLRHLADIRARLPTDARRRLEVRLAGSAPLWRFRMIFLSDALHLRLTVPGSAEETLIKLDADSSLFAGLRDILDTAWSQAEPQ